MASCCDGKNGLINQDVIEEDLYSESRELLEYNYPVEGCIIFGLLNQKKFHFPLEANKLDLLSVLSMSSLLIQIRLFWGFDLLNKLHDRSSI
jgi:hypothetical protein